MEHEELGFLRHPDTRPYRQYCQFALSIPLLETGSGAWVVQALHSLRDEGWQWAAGFAAAGTIGIEQARGRVPRPHPADVSVAQLAHALFGHVCRVCPVDLEEIERTLSGVSWDSLPDSEGQSWLLGVANPEDNPSPFVAATLVASVLQIYGLEPHGFTYATWAQHPTAGENGGGAYWCHGNGAVEHFSALQWLRARPGAPEGPRGGAPSGDAGTAPEPPD